MLPERFAAGFGEIVRMFAAAGARFSLGSDAHSLCGVGNLGWALKVARDCRVAAHVIRPVWLNEKCVQANS